MRMYALDATIDNDANDRGNKATVQTCDTVGGEGLSVHINESVELALAVRAGGASISAQARTGTVGRSASATARGNADRGEER